MTHLPQSLNCQSLRPPQALIISTHNAHWEEGNPSFGITVRNCALLVEISVSPWFFFFLFLDPTSCFPSLLSPLSVLSSIGNGTKFLCLCALGGLRLIGARFLTVPEEHGSEKPARNTVGQSENVPLKSPSESSDRSALLLIGAFRRYMFLLAFMEADMSLFGLTLRSQSHLSISFSP